MAADVDDIRRQMAQIRREIHEDMQGVVAGAEAATDWRYYVERYPWAALGLALAVGYLIVPKRRVGRAAERAAEETSERFEEILRRARTSGREPIVIQQEPPKKKGRFWGMIFGMVTPMLVRAAQNYASHYVENWIAQQQGMFGPLGAGFPPGASPTMPGGGQGEFGGPSGPAPGPSGRPRGGPGHP